VWLNLTKGRGVGQLRSEPERRRGEAPVLHGPMDHATERGARPSAHAPMGDTETDWSDTKSERKPHGPAYPRAHGIAGEFPRGNPPVGAWVAVAAAEAGERSQLTHTKA